MLREWVVRNTKEGGQGLVFVGASLLYFVYQPLNDFESLRKHRNKKFNQYPFKILWPCIDKPMFCLEMFCPKCFDLKARA
jgi:hypothetical protein